VRGNPEAQLLMARHSRAPWLLLMLSDGSGQEFVVQAAVDMLAVLQEGNPQVRAQLAALGRDIKLGPLPRHQQQGQKGRKRGRGEAEVEEEEEVGQPGAAKRRSVWEVAAGISRTMLQHLGLHRQA
jgi:hypothetical protein